MKQKQRILPRAFYERDPILVAKELLGTYLISNEDGMVTGGKIGEVEAYLAENDLASHSYRGKTKSNASMFGEGGHAYIHKMHGWNLLDLVAGPANVPAGILIRSLEPTFGIEIMKRRRKTADIQNLTSGPGKLCEALAITYDLDGLDITQNSRLYVLDKSEPLEGKIIETPRIGISKSRDLHLRFILSPHW